VRSRRRDHRSGSEVLVFLDQQPAVHCRLRRGPPWRNLACSGFLNRRSEVRILSGTPLFQGSCDLGTAQEQQPRSGLRLLGIEIALAMLGPNRRHAFVAAQTLARAQPAAVSHAAMSMIDFPCVGGAVAGAITLFEGSRTLMPCASRRSRIVSLRGLSSALSVISWGVLV
jgi:hypothetical protein